VCLCCSVLQCVAVCCTHNEWCPHWCVSVAVCCSVLQCAVCCTHNEWCPYYSVAVRSSVLQHVSEITAQQCCSTLQCDATCLLNPCTVTCEITPTCSFFLACFWSPYHDAHTHTHTHTHSRTHTHAHLKVEPESEACAATWKSESACDW